MKFYTLTRSDGYGINLVMQGFNRLDVQCQMKLEYNQQTPMDWLDEFKELSYCEEDNAICYDNGNNVIVWQIHEHNIDPFHHLYPNAIPEALALIDNCEPALRDQIYRHLWLNYVKEDIESHLDDMDIELTEDQIEEAARRYVYDGNYDCNLDYWTNIENNINEIQER